MTRDAVPPMWKVRMVSCVPGSPMDCAAMTPTASPSLDHAAGAEVTAVAEDADAALGFAGEDGADLDALDAGGLNGGGEVFVDLLVDVDDDLAFVVLELLERDAADDAVAQRLDDLAGLRRWG